MDYYNSRFIRVSEGYTLYICMLCYIQAYSSGTGKHKLTVTKTLNIFNSEYCQVPYR